MNRFTRIDDSFCSQLKKKKNIKVIDIMISYKTVINIH